MPTKRANRPIPRLTKKIKKQAQKDKDEHTKNKLKEGIDAREKWMNKRRKKEIRSKLHETKGHSW